MTPCARIFRMKYELGLFDRKPEARGRPRVG